MKIMLKTFFVTVFLAPVLIACTVDPDREASRMPTEAEIEQYNASVEPEDRIICRDEALVGTRISKLICRRSGEIDEISDLSQREWRRLTITNN